MSTPPGIPQAANRLERDQDLSIYSHSPLFYWWPVWAVGFIVALITFIDGSRMAVVPHGTISGHNAKGTVELQEKGKLQDIEGRDVYVLPPGSQAEELRVHTARSKNPGVIFAFTLILIILISSVSLRGLWSIVIIVLIVLLVTIFALLDWWDPLLEWIGLLRIHVNAGGYLFISLALFIIWAVTFFIFDRQTYLIFSAGQVRVYQQIGEGEKVFDTTNLTFEKRQNDFFRHWIIGLGAGDLKVKTGGPHPEEFELHNVLFVGNRGKQIEQRLKSREVV